MDAIVTQMIILFILVIIGYFLNKKKMMGADFDRKLSGLVINVTCPSLILSSVMGDTLPDKELIVPLLLVGFATYVVLIGTAFLLPRYLPVKPSDRGIYSFMLAFATQFSVPVRYSMLVFLISQVHCWFLYLAPCL